jgi:hypothetical protein
MYSVQVSEIAEGNFLQSLRGQGGPKSGGFPRLAPMENGHQELEKKLGSNRSMKKQL